MCSDRKKRCGGRLPWRRHVRKTGCQFRRDGEACVDRTFAKIVAKTRADSQVQKSRPGVGCGPGGPPHKESPDIRGARMNDRVGLMRLYAVLAVAWIGWGLYRPVFVDRSERIEGAPISIRREPCIRFPPGVGSRTDRKDRKRDNLGHISTDRLRETGAVLSRTAPCSPRLGFCRNLGRKRLIRSQLLK
jgi:hypothetical protein